MGPEVQDGDTFTPWQVCILKKAACPLLNTVGSVVWVGTTPTERTLPARVVHPSHHTDVETVADGIRAN